MFITIYKKTKDLLEKDVELAKEYFSNAITNLDNLEELAGAQIVNLFSQFNFGEDNTDFKLSLLLNKNLSDNLDEYAERKIFLTIIDKHECSKYLHSDNFTTLLDKYSRYNGFIDDAFVEVILKKARFIDEDAIYYILKSKGFMDISESNVDKLLKSYDLCEDTMASRVTSILASEEFIERVPHRKLIEFIERVSLNLKSKESKKFVSDILKLPSMKKEYLGSAHLFDFRYIDDNKILHISELLFKKDYYKKMFLCNDRDNAYQLISYFCKEDPYFLEYFKYPSLNDTSVKLDKDLLFGLIKSDYQDALISVTNSKYGEIFVKCANYLNERYPNINVAKLIKLLTSGVIIPEKFYEEIYTRDIAMITNYLLFGTNISIDSIDEYEFALIAQLDYVMKKNVSMSHFKDALCRNRYGFGFGRVHALYKMYREFVFNCDNDSLKEEFLEFEDIIYGKDKYELYGKYMTNIFTFDKANKYEMDIKREYTNELKKNIISIKDLKTNSMILYNGTGIPVVEIEYDFNMLISAVGFVTKLEVINDNYKDSLLMSENHALHSLSASIYSSDNLSRANGQFILGYSDFPDYTIQQSSPMDIYSTGNRYDVFTQYPSTYVPPKEMAHYTRHDYNELVIELRKSEKNGEIHLNNMYPTYVLLDNKSNSAIASAVKASRDLGIPIVYVDVGAIRNRKRKEYEDMINSYTGEKLEDYKKMIELIFREKNPNGMGEYFQDYNIVLSVTDAFLTYEHTREELLEAEKLLTIEINKGAAYDFDALYRSILKIRRKLEVIYPFEKYEIDKYSKHIDEALFSLIKKGYISQRHNGMAINDARALANASCYVYKCLAKKFGWSYSDIKEIIEISLFVSSNAAEYKYDYYLNRGSENENFRNYYKIYANLKQESAKLKRSISPYILEHNPIVGYRCINLSNGYDQVINLAYSIIEGESPREIAKYLEITPDELSDIRNKLIEVYNNKVKIVERRKK